MELQATVFSAGRALSDEASCSRTCNAWRTATGWVTTLSLLLIASPLLLLSGCASYGVVENAPGPVSDGSQSYSIRTFQQDWRTDENALMLAFSGGGTRAAAASSAAPVLFNPVVVRNYPDCGPEVPEWLRAVRARSADNQELALLVEGLETYFDRERWARELSTPQRPVEPYFILLDFDGIQEAERRSFLNRTPTSFRLSDEQVDGLIEAGGELLRTNPEFRRLLSDLGKC